MKHIIISFISPDKPGIVDRLSTTIKQHQGNWQTSSLHHLSGLFAGIIEITIQAQQTEALITALKSLTDLNLQIEIAPEYKEQQSEKITLELTANDRFGIVNEISSVIHHQQGNLIKLVSSQKSAPHTGLMMFSAKVHVAIAPENIDNMITALENIADDLVVDINR